MAQQCFPTLYPNDIINNMGGQPISNTKVKDMPSKYGYMAMDDYWVTQPGGTPDDSELTTLSSRPAISVAGIRADGTTPFAATSVDFVGGHPRKPH